MMAAKRRDRWTLYRKYQRIAATCGTVICAGSDATTAISAYQRYPGAAAVLGICWHLALALCCSKAICVYLYMPYQIWFAGLRVFCACSARNQASSSRKKATSAAAPSLPRAQLDVT
jgi:hypothetical protein